jgi:dihydrofolate reductase
MGMGIAPLALFRHDKGNQMRRLVSFNMITLDGFFEGPNHDLSWHHVDEEFNQFAIEQTGTFGGLLFGRLTYQMMADYWPTPEAIKNDPVVAGLMNRLPKMVFSRTMTHADWNNTRVVTDHIAENVLAVKQQPGGDLALFGSANLLATLIQYDLIDEHRIMLNPIVLGQGTLLFQGIQNKLKLNLVGTKRFHNGNLLLSYTPEKK